MSEPSWGPAGTSAPLLAALALEAIGPDVFTGTHQRLPSGRAYGGELVAQAQVAATRTVTPDRRIHSLHGYFLRPGDVGASTRWEVERLRDGRGYSARVVRGSQAGKVIFQAMASFHVPRDGVRHEVPAPPDLPAPESLPSAEQVLAGSSARDASYWASGRSFDIRHSPPAVYEHVGADRSLQQVVWLRAWDRLPDDPALHRAALAYVCDYTLLEPVLRHHGAAWAQPGVVTASLDHAMWWHGDGRVDEWVALVQESTVAQRGVALTSGRLYSRDGRLLASVAQEGMVVLPEADAGLPAHSAHPVDTPPQGTEI